MQLCKDSLLEVLYRLYPSEEKMRASALYIRLFKDDYQVIMDGLTHVYNNSGPHHRLYLFYLINEILLTERAEDGKPLRTELIKFIKDKFPKERQNVADNPPIFRRLSDLQTVWKTKGIVDFTEKFSPEEITQSIIENYGDKKKLASYLESVAAHFKENDAA